jgi:cysteinyl-tRNA synthetase
VDNMFPHHDDEIAQSEGATGKTFVKYWMHSAHLIVDGKKMSKSLGNFHTLRDVQAKGYSGREVRYVLLSAHYRQSLNFTFVAVDAARTALRRIDEFTARLRGLAGGGAEEAELPPWAVIARENFNRAMNTDLNVPEALGALFDMVHTGNRAMDADALEGDAGAVLELLADFDKVLGVLASESEEADAEVLSLVEARTAARQAKDWAESDRIRDELKARGWEVRDTPDGAKVKKL